MADSFSGYSLKDLVNSLGVIKPFNIIHAFKSGFSPCTPLSIESGRVCIEPDVKFTIGYYELINKTIKPRKPIRYRGKRKYDWRG